MKYKVGNRVKVLKSSYTNKKPYFGIVDKITHLGDLEIKGIKGRGWDEDFAYFHDLNKSEIELAERTLDNLEVGDVVENSGGQKTVLKKIDAYIMSDWENQERGNCLFSPEGLKNCDYKLLENDTIEIDGKKYLKEDVIKRVKKLKEIK